jgi:hypothetical protein
VGALDELRRIEAVAEDFDAVVGIDTPVPRRPTRYWR